MNQIISLPAYVESLSTRKDKSMKLVFSTQELMPSAASDLFSLQNQIAYLAIKPVLFTPDELKAVEEMNIDVADMEKSPSKRLRAVIFLRWKGNNEGYTDFNLYYSYRMEKYITHEKNQLPQR